MPSLTQSARPRASYAGRITIKFNPWEKKTPYIATPRKLAYAKRREATQKADIPLFPELVQTAEERRRREHREKAKAANEKTH